jgi:DNA-binding SARP family transcriptional activator
VGHSSDVVGALIVLGGAHLAAHSLGAARGCLQEALAGAEAEQLSESIAYAQQGLAMVALCHAGLPEAARLLGASLRRQHELGDRWRTASVLVTVATCERMRGNPLRTARMLGAAQGLLEQIGAVLPPVEQTARDQTIAALAAVLSRHELDVAWMTGRSEPLAASVSAALVSMNSDLSKRDSMAQRAYQPASQLRTPAAGIARQPLRVVAGDSRVAGPTGTPAPPLEIRVLGSEQVFRDGRPLSHADFSYAKPRELLFLLAEVESLDKAEIGLALWPDASPPELRNAFHTTLHHLRRAVGADRVSYAARRYRLNRDGVVYDVASFNEGLAAARAATSRAAEIRLLQEAVGKYAGDYLPSLDGGWVERRRAELRSRYCRALLALGRLLRTAGRHSAAIDAFTRVIEADPLSESGHRELMRSLAASGEPAKALRQFDLLEGMLRAELDAGPSDSTVALRSRIRAGQPV